MKSLLLTLILTVSYSLNSLTYGQNSLKEKYDNMIETTETYEQYKVIPRTTIDAFWAEVSDSLSGNSRTVYDLRQTIQNQQASITTSEAQVSDLSNQLSESLNQNDSINFLGISFSKVGYHLMVWLIIVTLAVLGVISYLMFMRSNRVTTRVKKEHEELIAEFDTHKDKARETQVKLKRELQTAINNLNERR